MTVTNAIGIAMSEITITSKTFTILLVVLLSILSVLIALLLYYYYYTILLLTIYVLATKHS